VNVRTVGIAFGSGRCRMQAHHLHHQVDVAGMSTS